MAIDPTLFQRSFDNAAGPALDPVAIRRQRTLDEVAGQEREYRAARLQAEQAQIAAGERDQQTLGEIGGMAAAGDVAGARNRALGAGRFDIIDKLDSMDDNQRKRTLDVTRSIAPVIASLKQVPPAMRMQAAASVLPSRGLSPQQIASLDLSDAGIDAKLGEAMTITEYLAKARDDRDFGFKQQEFGYRQRNDAANRGVSIRGQNITDARARGSNAVTLAGVGKATIKSEGDLRKEFNSRPEVKEFRDVATAYRQIKKAAANPTAANDLSLIFSYMKMLDPGSVVREGEFATAQNAAGIPDQVRNAYNRAASGERLNPKQRKQFVASAAAVLEPRGYRYNDIANEYRGYAVDYGGNPDRVATPVPTSVKASAKTAPVAGGKITTGKDGVRTWTPG